ncbi:MAG TPA: zinc ribbon domain-containing protein [Clostridia bacterium]|nr:zinc ribbon domain-containing protein [Clostridia bacterium]
MPFLKFKCTKCDHIFDELVRYENKDKLICPQCGGSELERAYQGKCLGSVVSSGSGCKGACASCKGCGH